MHRITPARFLLLSLFSSLIAAGFRAYCQVHSQARRYLSPEEHPFFPDRLKDPVLPPVKYPPVLVQQEIININPDILDVYIREVSLLIKVLSLDAKARA